MRKSRFSDEQISNILAEYRAGQSAAELCRKHNISPKTFYSWKAKFGDMQASEVRRVKSLEAQIAKLERIVAKQAVELLAAKDVISGKF
jgi:putative transposase